MTDFRADFWLTPENWITPETPQGRQPVTTLVRGARRSVLYQRWGEMTFFEQGSQTTKLILLWTTRPVLWFIKGVDSFASIGYLANIRKDRDGRTVIVVG